MDRDRILNELRGMVAQERFTANNIGSPGCQIRRVAEENIRALDAAIALMTADGEPTAWLCENREGHRDATLSVDTAETWRRWGRTVSPLYVRPA